MPGRIDNSQTCHASCFANSLFTNDYVVEFVEIVKGTEIKNDYYWVLNKNFESFGQDVKLSPKTAMLISQLLNSFCEVLNVKDDECDPKDINESDINNLLLICYHFINEAGEEIDPSRN